MWCPGLLVEAHNLGLRRLIGDVQYSRLKRGNELSLNFKTLTHSDLKSLRVVHYFILYTKNEQSKIVNKDENDCYLVDGI